MFRAVIFLTKHQNTMLIMMMALGAFIVGGCVMAGLGSSPRKHTPHK
jgi:hypothetical protein